MKSYSLLYYILYPYLKLDIKNKIIFFLIIVFSLLVVVFDLLTISVLSLVLFNFENSVIVSINDYLSFISKSFNNINYDLFKVVIIVFLLILRNIFFILQDYYLRSFVFKHYNINSRNLFRTYALSNLKEFNSKSIHVYLKNLNKETWYCYLGILYSLLYISVDLIYIIAVGILSVFIIDFTISYNLFFLVIFFILIIVLIFKKIKKFGSSRENAENKYYRDTLNVLKSYLEIKVYDKIIFFTNSYYKNLKTFSNTLIFKGIINLLPKALLETIISLILLFYLIFDNSSINLELFTLIAFILFRLSPVIIRIIQNINLIIFDYPSSKILINEEHKYSIKKNQKEKIVNFSINKISLKNANFSYGNNIIFKNLNSNFYKGKIYGIYGESGKGKTTLMMILSGLLKLKTGNLTINDSDFTKYNINWNNKIGVMSQYNIMIDDSLIQTLFLDTNVSKRSIKKAKEYLQQFNLKKIIKYLSPKRDYQYSLNGMLSGGEKQRLSIIRTILLGSEILFFDEPTASLDKNNELLVLEELIKLKKNKIVFVSTHKKDLERYFDKSLKIK